ncbi:hypothetical protein [Phaeocystidibacter marisrubri]|uniref:DUF4129 domain-containing protein n=1 Tax=Phaeocystidibacter marisrubri TaxID=1577780 RepID=A0A6L3ZJ73_9FLAO|nr:hypothetical protein [Phaeocystidibacter marisrubri]KAB2817659.1 hypothetical protein F8C82_04445 [Phaeocystidibacter marisrubri]GGH74248.1 hypothetical protein GCM10011318_20030 [Phaeocystidibacter marisrubri]
MKRSSFLLFLLLSFQLFSSNTGLDSSFYAQQLEEYDYSKEISDLPEDTTVGRAQFHPIDELKEEDFESQTLTQGEDESSGLFTTLLIIVLVFGIIGYLIWRYQNSGKNLATKELQAATSVEHAEKDLLNVSLDDLIRNAERSEDYRLLVHLHFLELLRALHEAKHISWVPYKTNGQYLYEISDAEVRRQYFDIVVVFDRVWYGYKEINAANFDIWFNRVNRLKS